MKGYVAWTWVLLACCQRSDGNRVVIDRLFAAKSAFAIVSVMPANSEELWRIDDNGVAQWERPLRCGAGGDVVADDAMVAVRCLAFDNHNKRLDRLSVYEAKDGHELWSRDEETNGAGPFGALRFTSGGLLVTTGEKATVYDQTGKSRLIYPMDSADGPLSDGPNLIFRGAKTTVINPVAATGATGPSLRGCVQRGEYVQLNKNGDLEFMPLANLTAGPRIEHIKSIPRVTPVIDACATHDKDRILEIYASVDHLLTLHVVRLDDVGTTIADIDLGAPDPADTALEREYPDLASLNGEVPRFNIVAVRDGTKSRLLLIDLDTGKVVWRGPDESLDQANVFRANGVWFVAKGDTLRMFDGTTGERTAAKIGSSGGVRLVGPKDVSADRIWLQGNALVPRSPPIGVLDRHLKPLYLRGITVEPSMGSN